MTCDGFDSDVILWYEMVFWIFINNFIIMIEFSNMLTTYTTSVLFFYITFFSFQHFFLLFLWALNNYKIECKILGRLLKELLGNYFFIPGLHLYYLDLQGEQISLKITFFVSISISCIILIIKMNLKKIGKISPLFLTFIYLKC